MSAPEVQAAHEKLLDCTEQLHASSHCCVRDPVYSRRGCHPHWLDCIAHLEKESVELPQSWWSSCKSSFHVRIGKTLSGAKYGVCSIC